MKEFEIVMTFQEPLLGTVPLDKEIYTSYIESKRPPVENGEEDEVDTVVEDPKSETGFHQLEDGTRFLMDYTIKGFFKDACGALRRVTTTESKKLTSYKKVIDGLVFVYPRQLIIETNGGEFDVLERPLRAQTAKGERVALARSQTAPVGSTITMTIRVLGGVSKKLMVEWLDYGAMKGLGQWRNAGYGRFTYTMKQAKA